MAGKCCTPTKKARLLTLANLGHKPTEIAQQLGIHPSTVRRNLTKLYQNPDPYAKKPKPGCPRILTPHSLRRAAREITSGQAHDAEDVRRQLFPHISPRSMRRYLCSIGLNGRVRRRKPLLTCTHKKKRNAWADVVSKWTLRDWQFVVFSDESKFSLVGSDGRYYCRRRVGEEFLDRNVDGTVKGGGGSLMVWGCVSWKGTGQLHRINGKMDAKQYCEILSESLLGTLSDHAIARNHFIFQQDNDPKHTSRRAKAWLKDNGILVLSWPPQSPDMNIIEQVWNMLDRKVRSRPVKPRNLDQLWAALQEEWERLDVGEIQALYKSMPRRTEALKAVKGGYTKY